VENSTDAVRPPDAFKFVTGLSSLGIGLVVTMSARVDSVAKPAKLALIVALVFFAISIGAAIAFYYGRAFPLKILPPPDRDKPDRDEQTFRWCAVGCLLGVEFLAFAGGAGILYSISVKAYGAGVTFLSIAGLLFSCWITVKRRKQRKQQSNQSRLRTS
jgi:membrane protein implicated in regulation of membrane protease activity